MYTRYTQGQNEEYFLSRSMYVLNQVLLCQVPLYIHTVLKLSQLHWQIPLSILLTSNFLCKKIVFKLSYMIVCGTV